MNGKENLVKSLIKKSKMTKSQFAKYFNIPLRTVDNWTSTSSNHRECAPYIIELMEYKLKKENIIKED